MCPKFFITPLLEINFYDSPRFGILARIPPINSHSKMKARTLYDASFAVIGPRLWNMIPKRIRDCSTIFTFKSLLDKYLGSFPDRPPVDGYVCQNNNSILEWNIANSDIY